jgi:DNA-binding NarL/FixJ family response regulator
MSLFLYPLCTKLLRYRRKATLQTAQVQIILVDDYEPWRRFLRLALLVNTNLEVIEEIADGVTAVTKAEELKPDLILLDIGLPLLNGIEAAAVIRQVAPKSKIIFISENRATDIVEAGLLAGGSGYVVKSDCVTELLTAIRTVLQGRTYLSSSLPAEVLLDVRENPHTPPQLGQLTLAGPTDAMAAYKTHKACFYSRDQDLLTRVTQFIGSALEVGNAAIVIVTESHRDSLLKSLNDYGLNMEAAVEQGKYLALDAAGILSMSTVNGTLDSVGCFRCLHNLTISAAEAAKTGQSRVAIFWECVQLLLAQQNVEATIMLEKLGNQLALACDVDILCGYSLANFRWGTDSYIFEQICQEHAAVRFW